MMFCDVDDDDDVCSKAQDEAKAAETKIVAEHDYTNILTYFRKVNTLRYVLDVMMIIITMMMMVMMRIRVVMMIMMMIM
jgi:hypothetical protein